MQHNKIAWLYSSTETLQLMSWQCTVSIYFKYGVFQLKKLLEQLDWTKGANLLFLGEPIGSVD